MHIFYRIKALSHFIKISALSIQIAYCAICTKNRPILRFGNCGMATRCLFCQSGTVAMSMASILAEKIPDIEEKHVYELSSRGALFSFLKKKAGKLTSSEYNESIPHGQQINPDVFCQDVQSLTFPDSHFDICTSTEVFEHVPDDLRGFSEIYRVLKPGGYHVFTVPIDTNTSTVERAVINNGKIVHLITPPEYHGDPFNGSPVLAYRTYGKDIIHRLSKCGFIECEIKIPDSPMPWNYAHAVIIAKKPER